MLKDRIATLAKDQRLAPLLQFIKFGLVGVSNTAISYGIDMLCYYVLLSGAPWPDGTKVIVSSAIAFIVSVTNSYYWNNRFVFGQGEKKTARQHLLTYGKTVLCYGVTGLVLAPLIKSWATSLGIAYWLGSLMSLVVTIPLNFILNKRWAFGEKRPSEE